MKLKLFLYLLVIALLWGGGAGTYTALTNLAPKPYSVKAYLQQRPPAKWLRLTDGELNMAHVNFTSWLKSGPVTEIYLPLRSIEANGEEKVAILVATKDRGLLNVANDLRGAKSEEDLARLIRLHRDSLLIHKDIQGLIREGFDLQERDVAKLRELNPNLTEDFIILAEGERPNISVSIAAFILGIAGAVWLATSLLSLLGSKKPVTGGTPPPLPPRSAGPPPLPR